MFPCHVQVALSSDVLCLDKGMWIPFFWDMTSPLGNRFPTFRGNVVPSPKSLHVREDILRLKMKAVLLSKPLEAISLRRQRSVSQERNPQLRCVNLRTRNMEWLDGYKNTLKSNKVWCWKGGWGLGWCRKLSCYPTCAVNRTVIQTEK